MSDHALRKLRYAEWLAGRNLQFGFADEIAALATRVTKGVKNDSPPVEMWADIVPTVRLLEMVRAAFGATTIHSAYRSPIYNAALPGETASLHMQNKALDFSCATGTPAQWQAFLQKHRREKAFRGGIGVYATFVHVDTRGSNADWVG